MARNTKKKKTSSKLKNKKAKTTKQTTKASTPKVSASELEAKRRVNFEIINIVFVALSIFLFASNFGYCGAIGNLVSNVIVGLFGTIGYIFPFIILLILLINNYLGQSTLEKIITCLALIFLICSLVQLMFADEVVANSIGEYVHEFYNQTKNLEGVYTRNIGGGAIGGLIYLFLSSTIAKTGAYIVILFLILICLVILTRKPLMSIFAKKTSDGAASVGKGVKNTASYVNDYFKDISNTKLINETGFDYDEPQLDSNAPNFNQNINPNYNQSPNFDFNQNPMINPIPNQNINTDYFDISKVVTPASSQNQNNGYQFTNPSFIQNNEDLYKFDNQNHKQGMNLDLDSIALKKRMEEQRRIEQKKAEEQIPYHFDTIDDSIPFDMSYKKDNPEDSYYGSEKSNYNNNYDNYGSESAGSSYINASESQTADQSDANATKQRLLEKYREKMRAKKEGSNYNSSSSLSQSSMKSQSSSSSNNTARSSTDPSMTNISQVKKRHRAYTFPPLNLLKRGSSVENNSNSKPIKEACANLENLFAQFKIGIRVVDVTIGPSVIRYEVELAQGIPVKTISKYTEDIKLSLKVENVRIAPIPEKGLVGIEVPNKNSQVVCLGDLIASRDFRDGKGELVFALGKDLGGKNIYTDIDKMPHLLIAGATGSGKSVCVNTLILSLCYKYKPDDVKLIMIDPKMVELQGYNGIPHLLIPVVCDAKKATNALAWAVNEMEVRYKLFASSGVRNLNEYNKKVDEKLPRIVIIIDEFADLMMVSSKEVENAVVRISQLARAAGLHLVIATQRPSVNVITGVIKANILSRIAFAVSSGIDSRTILDMEGAEKLLGKGDMLFYPTGSPKPIRIQGCFVSNKEINDVIDYIKVDGENFDQEIIEKIENTAGSSSISQGETSSSGLDSQFVEIGLFAIAQGTIAIGTIQRRFSMGFNRAARIIDQLEENGVIGPADGKKARDILMTEIEFREKFGG